MSKLPLVTRAVNSDRADWIKSSPAANDSRFLLCLVRLRYRVRQNVARKPYERSTYKCDPDEREFQALRANFIFSELHARPAFAALVSGSSMTPAADF